MQSPLVIVTGTGTGIGKTHFAAALTSKWGDAAKIMAFKPLESGVKDIPTSDIGILNSVSTFHVKPTSPLPYLFSEPISPHLASRHEQVSINPETIIEEILRLRSKVDGLVVELPGGLFSPLTSDLLNINLLHDLHPTMTLLVAPDRLGVLHEVISTERAALEYPISLTGVILNPPPQPDLSTGTNAAELPAFIQTPVLGTLPRGNLADLAESPPVQNLIKTLLAHKSSCSRTLLK